MVALLKLLISPIIDPMLPYWLYFRYKVSRIAGNLRVPYLQQKYRFLLLQKKWDKEEWLVVE